MPLLWKEFSSLVVSIVLLFLQTWSLKWHWSHLFPLLLWVFIHHPSPLILQPLQQCHPMQTCSGALKNWNAIKTESSIILSTTAYVLFTVLRLYPCRCSMLESMCLFQNFRFVCFQGHSLCYSVSRHNCEHQISHPWLEAVCVSLIHCDKVLGYLPGWWLHQPSIFASEGQNR